MPSALGHIAAASSLAYTLGGRKNGILYWCAVFLLAILPDFDVLSFNLGIPYAHPLGHRGFFHSIAFAMLMAGLATSFIRGLRPLDVNHVRLFLTLSFIALIHPLLDAMTTGGLGVGLLMPFDQGRHFLPWRPIKVSPIGVREFLGLWGYRVLRNELAWIVIPSILVAATAFVIKRSFCYFRDTTISKVETNPSQAPISAPHIERKPQ